MPSRLQQPHSNAGVSARIRAVGGSLRFAARGQRLGAIACLVALCGIIFGVGAALGRPDAARPAQATRVAHVRAPRANRAHPRRATRRATRRAHRRQLRMGVRALRPRRAHRGPGRRLHARRLAMRRMVARAAQARRARARHGLAVRAARARQRRHPAKKSHKRLTMRSFASAPASASVGIGQSLPGSLVDVARPGSGALVSTAPAAVHVHTAAATVTGSAQLNALSVRVRAVASAATSPAPATLTRAAGAPARPPRTAKPRAAHGGTAPASTGSRFLLPLGVPSPIEHFVNVVPEPLWIALVSALALAGIGSAAAVRAGRRARRQAGAYAAVAAVAVTDPLTGVLNRRGFGEAVDRELARARRYETSFVLAYVDVRGLKAVNDSEGHLAGDAVIRQVARLLSDSVRAEDAVGRLGGDELAVLLTGQSADGADAVIERIEADVPDCRAELGLDTHWDVTIGTASYPADGAGFEQLVAIADRRLYEQRGIQIR